MERSDDCEYISLAVSLPSLAVRFWFVRTVQALFVDERRRFPFALVGLGRTSISESRGMPRAHYHECDTRRGAENRIFIDRASCVASSKVLLGSCGTWKQASVGPLTRSVKAMRAAGGRCEAHGLLLFVLLSIFLLPPVVAVRPSWWSCVRDIGMYFEPKSDVDFSWSVDNPCGFTSLSVEDVRSGVFFARNNVTISFAGDSTALRAYVYAVNTYLPPNKIPVIKKVADVPRVMVHHAEAEYGGQRRLATSRFFNMRYVSTSLREIEEGIMQCEGGVMVITLGNWDLNWKLQRHAPMPHLGGPVHNFEVAKAYWLKHVTLMMQHIATFLDKKRKASSSSYGVPRIVFREQFLPNCAASRFLGKKGAFRRCGPLIRPLVVPLYRRILAPLAWSLNIPVIPMDHVFRDGWKYCAMNDGIHLDFNCMMTEQQHIWNVVLLMERHHVVQGLGTVNDQLAALPDAKEFFDVQVYEQWRREMDLVPRGSSVDGPPRGVAPTNNVTHHGGGVVVGTFKKATTVLSDTEHTTADGVQGGHQAGTAGTVAAAAAAAASTEKFSLRVEVHSGLATVSDHRQQPERSAPEQQNPIATHRGGGGSVSGGFWQRWGHFLVGTVSLVGVTVYLTWAVVGARD